MTMDKRKKALRYLLFLKEKSDSTLKAWDVLTDDHKENTQQERR